MPRRFRPLRTWRFWVGWLIVLAIAARVAYLTRQEEPTVNMAEGAYHVDFVIDGDTLILADGKRVRLIGVDAPETKKRDRPVERWGPEATQFAREFLDVATGDVRLQFDDERLDIYGRYLAYVWTGERMLNEELIRAGLGRFSPGFHYSETMKRRFRLAEREAQTKRLGIWSTQPSGK